MVTKRPKKRGPRKLTAKVRRAVLAAKQADPRATREDVVAAVWRACRVRVSTGSVTALLAAKTPGTVPGLSSAEKDKGGRPNKAGTTRPTLSRVEKLAAEDDDSDVDLSELVNGQLRRLQRLVRTATANGDTVEAARAARDAHDWARVALRLAPPVPPDGVVVKAGEVNALAGDVDARFRKMLGQISLGPACALCGARKPVDDPTDGGNPQ